MDKQQGRVRTTTTTTIVAPLIGLDLQRLKVEKKINKVRMYVVLHLEIETVANLSKEKICKSARCQMGFAA